MILIVFVNVGVLMLTDQNDNHIEMRYVGYFKDYLGYTLELFVLKQSLAKRKLRSVLQSLIFMQIYLQHQS